MVDMLLLSSLGSRFFLKLAIVSALKGSYGTPTSLPALQTKGAWILWLLLVLGLLGPDGAYPCFVMSPLSASTLGLARPDLLLLPSMASLLPRQWHANNRYWNLGDVVYS